MSARGKCARLLGGLVVSVVGVSAAAQDTYPSRPIRYITPYSPGGSTTFTARFVGPHLTEAWGQQVVVDNRPGADTLIGNRIALESSPDGYTLLNIGATLAANHTLRKTPYDALKDVTYIATVFTAESVLVVPPPLPVKTVKDLVALAKAKPGQIAFGTSSHGGPTPLLAALFSTEAGISTLHVPYKGGGPAVADLLGGHIQFFFSNPSNVAALIRDGRLRPLAVTGTSRVPAFPDVPTFVEAGMPNILLTSWQGVGGPAGIPKSIVNRIAAEVQKLVAKPKSKEILTKLGFVPWYNGPEETAALLKEDVVKYAKIIKAANITMDQ
jgi:tripartite-type tricarboxylate transporter receptor subunit TctC